MTQWIGNDARHDEAQQEQRGREDAAEHGHTGEGAASALAHLHSQGERRRRELEGADEGLTSGG